MAWPFIYDLTNSRAPQMVKFNSISIPTNDSLILSKVEFYFGVVLSNLFILFHFIRWGCALSSVKWLRDAINMLVAVQENVMKVSYMLFVFFLNYSTIGTRFLRKSMDFHLFLFLRTSIRLAVRISGSMS